MKACLEAKTRKSYEINELMEIQRSGQEKYTRRSAQKADIEDIEVTPFMSTTKNIQFSPDERTNKKLF